MFDLDARPTMLFARATKNADGRNDAPMMDGDLARSGTFELRFHLGEYFTAPEALRPGAALSRAAAVRAGVSRRLNGSRAADGDATARYRTSGSPFGRPRIGRTRLTAVSDWR
nr:hypothetical protein [Burkholderia cenocepacia]